MGDTQGASRNLSEAVQGAGNLFNADPSQVGQAERELQDVLNQQAASLAESREAREARASGGARSWLMALAQALGEKLDAKAAEVSSLADQITDDSPSITAKFGAASQEFNVLMNAATTAIKTLGEAMAGMARKQ